MRLSPAADVLNAAEKVTAWGCTGSLLSKNWNKRARRKNNGLVLLPSSQAVSLRNPSSFSPELELQSMTRQTVHHLNKAQWLNDHNLVF